MELTGNEIVGSKNYHIRYWKYSGGPVKTYKIRPTLCLLALSTLSFFMGALEAHAQNIKDYPNKSITLIVPFPPGGATDALSRIVAQKLSTNLGQSVIVENHPGAGGTIGASLGMRAIPDGYTLLFTTSSTHSVAPSFPKKLPYDSVADFTPIGGVAVSPAILMVTKTLPIKTVKDLVVYAKARPGELNYASSGVGTVIQLNAEAVKAQAGINMTHVPYKGSALAMPDLVSGKVHVLFDSIVSSLQPVKDGKLTALAVGGVKRSPQLPDVPTVAEAGKDLGLGQFESSTWFGLYGPKNLSPELVTKINAALNKAIESPDVVERFFQVGAEPLPGTPNQFASMVAKERARWSALIKQAQINPE
jgi:tripartite-type tricarboxylate transporter receptor subunit TctC